MNKWLQNNFWNILQNIFLISKALKYFFYFQFIFHSKNIFGLLCVMKKMMIWSLINWMFDESKNHDQMLIKGVSGNFYFLYKYKLVLLCIVYSKVCEISFFLLQKYEEMRGPWNQQKTLPWARYICSMTISTIIGSIYARTHGFSCRWSFENFTF